MSEELVERVARAICAHTNGFCHIMGGDQGCKVGRGEAYNGSNCAARDGQLQLSAEWQAARAAIEAIRNDPEALVTFTPITNASELPEGD